MPSVILLGSKPAAVVALKILLKRRWQVEAVVVAENFDLSWYGGQTIQQLAQENAIPVYTQAKLPRSLIVDYVISYQFRNLVKADVLALARKTSLNFHAAPLPRFGGFAYYSMAILENVNRYGVSCHHMDEKFDTGALVKVREFPIDTSVETACSLEARAQEEMLLLFADICVAAESGDLPMVPQEGGQMRYLDRKQFEELKRVPSDADAETIDRWARAFWYPPYEGATMEINGHKIELIPELGRLQLGQMMHRDDLDRLMRRAMEYRPTGF